jgi:transcriptional regulator with XRE-family HTH domain
MLDIGKQLADYRKKRRLTRSQVAELTGMNVDHLRGIELGVHKYPHDETVAKIARVLRVDVRVVVEEQL